MQCSNAMFCGHLSEVNRRVHVQCKACSDILLCARSRTSGSIVFLTLSLVRCMRLQAINNCGYFQIQLGMSHFHSRSLSSSFRNFHVTSVCFHGPQCGRIPLHYKPLPAFRSVLKRQLKSELWSIVVLSKDVLTPRNWKLCRSPLCDWRLLTAVASLANQIIWTILTMIVIGLFNVLYQRALHGWRHFYSLGKQSLVWKFSRMRGLLSNSLS